MRNFVLFPCIFAVATAMLAQGPPPGPGPGFGGGRGRGFGFGPGFGRTVLTGHPYSATETTTTVQILADGNRITHTNTAQVYRDKDGRTRVETTITPPPGSTQTPFTEIVITDPVAGYRYVLNSSTMTATQMPLPKPRTSSSSSTSANPPPPPQRPGVTITTTDLPATSVNGVAATGKQVTETIAAGAIGNANPIVITRISYVSTDLQVPVQIKTSDPRFGTSDFELTHIVLADPDPSLFQVPSTYTIRTGGPGARGAGPAFRRPPQ